VDVRYFGPTDERSLGSNCGSILWQGEESASGDVGYGGWSQRFAVD
jgi:hypothetical protein